MTTPVAKRSPRRGISTPFSERRDRRSIILSTPRRRKPSHSPSPSPSPRKKIKNSCGKHSEDVAAMRDLEESSRVRKARRRMLEEALMSLPEPGCGRVMYLVKTFERLLSMPKEAAVEEGKEEAKSKVVNWALPGLLLDYRPAAEATDFSYSFDFSSPSEDDDEQGILSCRSSVERFCW